MAEHRNTHRARGPAAVRRRRPPRLLGGIAAVAALAALVAPVSAGAAPIGMVCTDGPSFDLVARDGYVETPDGNSIYMWGYAPAGGAYQAPGPTLCVNQGDTVTVNLENNLAEPASIVFPGQEGVTATGGDAGLFAREAPAAGGTVTYTFTASEPGTYLYESGTDPSKQVEMGLYGALVVRPAGHPDWAYDDSSTEFDPDREYLLLLSEADPTLHRRVERGRPYDVTTLHNRYFQINGREFPDTIQDNGVEWLPHQPYGALVRVQPYDASNPLPALVRVLNAGLVNHPFHPHGNHTRLIAHDGRLIRTPGGADASTEHFAETIPSGATEDLLFKWTDQDSFSPSSPVPVSIPNYRNLAFKDGNTFYSGSPYLGYKGTLPNTATQQNLCGEFYFPWHSHALNEFTNFDEGFGGMATLLRLDPLGGCFAAPQATQVQVGTRKTGTFRKLAADDAQTYQVNSTTSPPRSTSWVAVFKDIPAGWQNPKLTYKGGNSVNCSQSIEIYSWTTATWELLDTRTVGAAEELIADLMPAGQPGTYVGTGPSTRGRVRIRVSCESPSPNVNFFSSGNLMKLVYDAP